MNKLKLFEAMNLIDDDLVKEAEEPSDTVSEAETNVTTDTELIASGVEIYKRSGWQKFAAIAAAFLLTAGLAGGGAYYLKNRRADVNNTVDSEIIAPVTNNGNIITTENDYMESASTVTTDRKPAKQEQSETTVTASSDKKVKTTETKATDKKNNDIIQTTTYSKGGNTSTITAKTTGKQNSDKTTTYKTTTAPNVSPPRPTVAVPSDRRMTENELLQFIKYFDEDMTWNDFEPYEHEDIGSGQWVWRIPVYENNVQKYTLLVCGVIDKKPSGIYLYKGTDTNNQERIDLRSKSDDVFEFIYPENNFSNVLGTLKDCHPDFINTIEISSPNSSHNAFLGYSEIQRMLELIRNVEIIRNEGNAWQTSSTMYYGITINDNQNVNHNFSVQYPYIIINGTGYRASEESISALSAYCKEIFDNRQPSQQIDVNGVWCWYDSTAYSGNPRDKTDCITIKQFPDLVFDFHGKNHTIAVYNTNGTQYGVAGARFNVYFTDINGDGYPELCSTNDWGLNSMIVIEAGVWDIHNNKHYSIASPDEYNYYLYEENGELFVNKESDTSAWHITSKHGEKGRLRIEDDNLIFVPYNN